MSFDQDEEILQDFLIEAGEILEALSEQLVTLENEPDNTELLNAIFRGFHTVKGGAGFLSLNELVDVCHGAENVFDILRNQQRRVTPELMDIILQALDTINEIFEQVKNREPLSSASPQLLAELHRLSAPEGEDSEQQAATPIENSLSGAAQNSDAEIIDTVEATSSETSASSSSTNSDDEEMTEDEFERLLDELQVSSPQKNASSPAEEVVAEQASSDDSNEITDDDFEALLDELHGKGAFSATTADDNKASDEIDDDDFEALLDELHGKGNAPKMLSEASETVQQSDLSEAKTPTAASAPKPASTKPTSHSSAEPSKATHANSNDKQASSASNQVAASKTVETKPVAEQKPSTTSAKASNSKKSPQQTETTVRVDTRRLDQIMNMVGELVLVRNRLTSLSIKNEKEDEQLNKAISNLDAVTTDLQGAVMKTRMQPIKKVFGRFPRVVRDLARTLNKEIQLKLEGEETDLDKNLVEALADPLVHLVRNSVDHGIESPQIREQAGKPREGLVVLSASQEGDHILLTIKDDGAGMNAEKLKSIAIERGVLDEEAAARMPNKDAFSLIFAPGFSTKTEISEVSGRGVGMDVVKTKITQLNGSINIDSELGVGTVLEIKVPLTLAILPTLMVNVGEQIFALPLTVVNEIVHLDLTRTNMVDGQLTIIVREKAIPLFYLDKWLLRAPTQQTSDSDSGHVVIVQLGNRQIGFVVDSLIGQEEVVIKPLDKLLHGTPGIAGATITSDGGIALIIDVPSLLKHYTREQPKPKYIFT